MPAEHPAEDELGHCHSRLDRVAQQVGQVVGLQTGVRRVRGVQLHGAPVHVETLPQRAQRRAVQRFGGSPGGTDHPRPAVVRRDPVVLGEGHLGVFERQVGQRGEPGPAGDHGEQAVVDRPDPRRRLGGRQPLSVEGRRQADDRLVQPGLVQVVLESVRVVQVGRADLPATEEDRAGTVDGDPGQVGRAQVGSEMGVHVDAGHRAS